MRNTFVTEDSWDHQNLEEQDQKKCPSSVMRCVTCTARLFRKTMYPWAAKNTRQDSPSVLEMKKELGIFQSRGPTICFIILPKMKHASLAPTILTLKVRKQNCHLSLKESKITLNLPVRRFHQLMTTQLRLLSIMMLCEATSPWWELMISILGLTMDTPSPVSHSL